MAGLQPHIRSILDGTEGEHVVAFFDFDGTVIDGYSIEAFYRQRLRDRDLGPVEIIELLAAALRPHLDEDRFTDLAERAALTLTGRDEDDLLELGRRLLVQRLGAALFPEAWELIQAHKRMGHTVVIASAASRFQIEPMAEELGADHVLCTRFETDNGMLTGRLDGPPLWGAKKAAAVAAFATDHGVDLVDCLGYANGDEDIQFLNSVGRPHAVNPATALAEHADAAGWPVLHFERRRHADPVQLARSAGLFGMMATGGVFGLAATILNRDRRQGIDLASGLIGDLSLAMVGVDVEVQGREHLWSHRPAVFVFNHQSGIDMPVLLKLLREGFTGVAKHELKNSPFGPFFWWADVAFVDRSNTTQARAALQPVVDKLNSGVSIVIAPEGTRSATPRLGPFKKGAFHMAMQAGVPVVPIVIRNAGEIAWRNSLVARSGTIDVVVHPPIAVDEWSVDTLDAHIADVRQLFVDTLSAWPGRSV